MCPQHDQPQHGRPERPREEEEEEEEGGAGEWPGEWETMDLPPDHVLSHLTDAHCHPTDLEHAAGVYERVPLGGLAAMATVPEDQEKVQALGASRPWPEGWRPPAAAAAADGGPRVVSCFGYHPWFTHRYTLHPVPPSKEEHYTAVFFPPPRSETHRGARPPDTPRRQRERAVLDALLPHLPAPVPLGPLLEGVRGHIRRARAHGRLAMLGEVGLDGGARVVWPQSARGLYDETTRTLRAREASGRAAGSGDEAQQGEEAQGERRSQGERQAQGEQQSQQTQQAQGEQQSQQTQQSQREQGGQGGRDSGGRDASADNGSAQWKRLTPLKISMQHQRAVLKAQLELAIELAVPVSLHCVAAAGPTVDLLKELRDAHGPRFTHAVNLDLHSAGGWAPAFWTEAAKQLSNLYASPSILITARARAAPDLVRAIPRDRMLVESDTHDVRQAARLVWGAAEWIARCKGWKLEAGRTGECGAGEEGKGVRVGPDEARGRRYAPSDAQALARTGGRDGPGGDEGGEGGDGGDGGDGEVWTVRTLERNWARFMGLIQPYE